MDTLVIKILDELKKHELEATKESEKLNSDNGMIDCIKDELDELSLENNGGSHALIEDIEAYSPLTSFFIKSAAMTKLSENFFNSGDKVDDTKVVDKIKRGSCLYPTLSEKKIPTGFYTYFDTLPLDKMSIDGYQCGQSRQSCTIPVSMDGNEYLVDMKISYGTFSKK